MATVVAHRMDVALVMGQQFLIIRPDVQIQVFLDLVMRTMNVTRRVAVIRTLVMRIFGKE
jgi:hypothetical protein